MRQARREAERLLTQIKDVEEAFGKKNEIDLEITGLDADTIASVKDNRRLRDK